MSQVEQRDDPFRYLGGQDMAVRTLRAVVQQEENGNFPGRKPLVLLTGQPGMGKTAFVTATAQALEGAVVTRTTEDFLSSQD